MRMVFLVERMVSPAMMVEAVTMVAVVTPTVDCIGVMMVGDICIKDKNYTTINDDDDDKQQKFNNQHLWQ